jgi:hypothetical protein
MIKATELRIGNCVRFGRKIVKILSINTNGQCAIDARPPQLLESTNELITIPLTHIILLKCGFEVEGNRYQHDYFRLRPDENFGDGYLFDEGVILRKVRHTHQLQNLYFALMAEELTVNP